MGHREKLLAGAKRCLYERGYGRTTARDIVEASGTNLASIGYHFGSKEALLNAAMIEAVGEWGEELERGLLADADEEADPMGIGKAHVLTPVTPISRMPSSALKKKKK